MPRYDRSKNWRAEWEHAKHDSNLSNLSFRKGLGKLLDAQVTTYDKFMQADATTFAKLAKEHGTRAVKIRDVLTAYRKIVKDKGNPVDAVNTLNNIDTKFLTPQLDDRMAKQKELGLSK